MSLTPPMPLSATHHVRQSADVDVFNVLDYGGQCRSSGLLVQLISLADSTFLAKADNSSDNTAAFAAAINAAKAANGGPADSPADAANPHIILF